MASDHPVVRLGDYVDACLGKMLDAEKNRGELHPYLGNSNVRWGSFELEALSTMRFEDHEEERYGIRDGDLIVCEGGEPGRCAIWRGNAPMKIQKALHRVRTKAGLDNYFLYYWFLRAGRTGELEPFFTGTTIKHLTGKALAELRIPLPPIDLQREAARVLRWLDEKIDLNHRINQTLEAMAQAIFKSWFVDFDPVKAKIAAKAEGRDPLRAAMSAISGKAEAELDALPPEALNQLAATAALFPEEMQESELGEIPKGWAVKPAEFLADVGIGKTPPRKEPQWFTESEGDWRWVSIKDMGASGVFQQTSSEFVTSAAVTRFNIRVVPDRTVLLSFKLTIGRVAITDGPMVTNEAIAHFKLPSNTEVSSEYLYLYLKGFDYSTLGSTSSIADAVNSKTIRGMPIVVAECALVDRFTTSVAPFFEELRNRQNEIEALSETRDALLPKLLSGEIEVPA